MKLGTTSVELFHFTEFLVNLYCVSPITPGSCVTWCNCPLLCDPSVQVWGYELLYGVWNSLHMPFVI